jgi:serine/threonine protein kinase
MQEHRATCQCGSELYITLEPDSFCQIRCGRCQQIIFLQKNKQEVASLAQVETMVEGSPATAETMAFHATVEDSVAADTSSRTLVSADAGQGGVMREITAQDAEKLLQKRPEEAKPPVPADPIVPGAIAGKYELIKLLGQGGMGKVFLARAQENQEQVVVKFLKIEAVPLDKRDKFSDYFLREMQVLKEMNHPNVVKFKGCGNFSGYPYLAMEFIDGDTLEHEIKENGPMKLSIASFIVFYVAAALEYGKNNFNLIHRDIKPGNIMLLRNNKRSPKLIDFGLAKTQDNYHALTLSGTTMGTLCYMPPEQIGDAKHADARADIYALGATFYHMLAGRAPFSEIGASSAILRAKQQKQATTPLSQIRRDVPARVCEIIDTAMSFNLGKRYPAITQFKKDLKDFIDFIESLGK